jgi:hypothetical protein
MPTSTASKTSLCRPHCRPRNDLRLRSQTLRLLCGSPTVTRLPPRFRNRMRRRCRLQALQPRGFPVDLKEGRPLLPQAGAKVRPWPKLTSSRSPDTRVSHRNARQPARRAPPFLSPGGNRCDPFPGYRQPAPLRAGLSRSRWWHGWAFAPRHRHNEDNDSGPGTRRGTAGPQIRSAYGPFADKVKAMRHQSTQAVSVSFWRETSKVALMIIFVASVLPSWCYSSR